MSLMMHSTYIPGPPLSDFVDMFWFYEGGVPQHAKERVLPSGCAQLFVNLQEDRFRVYDPQDQDKCISFRGCLMSGPHSEFVVIDTANQASIIGIAFKPGGAFPFFNSPARGLHNLQVPLELLWGRQANDLRGQLLEAKTTEARFRLLEQYLLAQAGWPGAPAFDRHPAVAFALKELGGSGGRRTVSEVTDQIGLSARRFIQVFSEEVGLTPKLYCRVRRLQEALGLVSKTRHVDWAALAARSGYFDQAHFIHDFRAFSGLNPSTYLANRGEYQNHVALPD
jgi:AraC-like DNA-binding protein